MILNGHLWREGAVGLCCLVFPRNHDHGTHRRWTLLGKGHRLVRAMTLLLRDEQQADGRKVKERKKKEDC